MPRYFEFEVSLVGVKPRIWRRFLLKDTLSFQALHETIQDACGWWNYHLFSFQKTERGPEIARVNFDDGWGMSDAPTAGRVRLSSYFKKKGNRCYYHYDFGDSWWHLTQIKDIIELPETFRRRLVDGARAFPREDCGGLWGYEDCCRTFALTPEEIRQLEPEEREDVESRREWMGDWNPEMFDLEAVKKVFDQ